MFALESLKKIQENVNQINNKVTIVVVSKTFPIAKVQPLINSGHLDYGENKVQEAKEKWSEYLDTNSNIKLHMNKTCAKCQNFENKQTFNRSKKN
jgi:uncharacterized pyridoxal phosphate-containing UPF0001 family protein